ncbi:MAG TPA: DUF1579 domain-containing protein [Devosia sp.]|nr:DUF1579 domain-containing protein [Devosia sp.]
MPSAQASLPTGDIHDFDFLHGNWSVTNRRLRKRFAGSDDWDVFAGVQRCEPRLGGAANVDEINCPTRDLSGLTIRLFDRAARLWSIYWVNAKGAVLFPPVLGGFSGDAGAFYGTDDDDGIAVQVRFDWLKQGSLHARWSQAFSRDGAAWETNWIMEFTRTV